MNIAYVCTPHGFGHLTRQVALGTSLHQLGCHGSFYCHHPAFVKNIIPNINVYKKSVDIGVIQNNSLEVDIEKTKEVLQQQQHNRIIEEWAEELKDYDVVIADIPPQIFAAGQLANVPVLGVSNFDWVWIYQQFEDLKPWAQMFAQWQKGHDGVQLNPGPPLHLNIQAQFQWLARTAQPCAIPKKSVLIAFGGLGIAHLHELPKIPGIQWVCAPPAPQIIREDFCYITAFDFPSLVESSSIVLSKAGYGILAEGMRSGTPQIWMHRPMFPESKYLESYARKQGDIIIHEAWGTQQWKQSLTLAIQSLIDTKRKGQPLDNDRLALWIVQNYS